MVISTMYAAVSGLAAEGVADQVSAVAATAGAFIAVAAAFFAGKTARTGKDSASAAKESAEIALREAERESLLIAADLHRDLTTGEVAEARDVIGSWIYQDSSTAPRSIDATVRHSYYVLLWAFERLSTGVQVLKVSQRKEALNILRDSAKWHVLEIAANLNELHHAESSNLQDEEAWTRFEECTDILQGAHFELPPLGATITR